MLVSRVCSGINVFLINIERKGNEKLASVSTIMTGIVATKGWSGFSTFYIVSCDDSKGLSCLIDQVIEYWGKGLFVCEAKL